MTTKDENLVKKLEEQVSHKNSQINLLKTVLKELKKRKNKEKRASMDSILSER